MHTAQGIRKAWKLESHPPCDHPHIEEERYDDGRTTGDYVCTTCGAYVDPQTEGSEFGTTTPKADRQRQSIWRTLLSRFGW